MSDNNIMYDDWQQFLSKPVQLTELRKPCGIEDIVYLITTDKYRLHKVSAYLRDPNFIFRNNELDIWMD